MEKNSTLTELRRKAREGLSRNWGVAVLSNLIVGLILLIVPNIFGAIILNDRSSIAEEILNKQVNHQYGGFIDSSYSYRSSLDDSVLTNILILIAFVIGLFITGALTYGLTKVFLNIKRGEKSKIEMIFDGFKKYKETFFINLLVIIFRVLWGLLWAVGFILLIIINVAGELITKKGGIGSGIIIGVILYIIGMIALVISYLIFINRYSMTYFIALDNEGIGSMEALEESIRIMKGNQIRYFLLQLSFIGWYILAYITCGLGLLWLKPYIQTANAAFYDDLIGRTENDFDFKLME